MTTSPPADDASRLPIAVPFEPLSPRALRGLVEAYVLREGTDYGEHEYSLDAKVAQVIGRLERGEAEIAFDPVSGTATILPTRRPSRR